MVLFALVCATARFVGAGAALPEDVGLPFDAGWVLVTVVEGGYLLASLFPGSCEPGAASLVDAVRPRTDDVGLCFETTVVLEELVTVDLLRVWNLTGSRLGEALRVLSVLDGSTEASAGIS